MTLSPPLQDRLASLQLFDAHWYRERYSDVRQSGMDPWLHFLDHGLEEGRQPGPAFDPNAYLAANPDLNSSALPALRHYLQRGHQEGRPLSVAEKEAKQATGSVWPESPPPPGLPEWFGGYPGPAATGNVRILYVLSVQSGGTPQTNQDLMAALCARDDANIECFVLRCAGLHLVLYLFQKGIYVPLERHRLEQPVPAFSHRLADYDSVVAQWLADYRIDLVHVRHLAWQGLGLMDVACQLDIPVVYSFHDYYSVCPSVKLLDENSRFCGGRCTVSRGECHQELWPNNAVLPLKHESVYQWQRQFAGALGLCDGFVTTSAQVRDITRDVFPAIGDKPFALISHGRDFQELAGLAVAPSDSEPLRVLLPGHIASSKGAEVLLRLASDQALSRVEWHVLGTLAPEFQLRMPKNVIVHGAYQREAFNDHVAQIRPHVGAVLSIWPETWCHTLTELWAAGLPVVGFDIGAVGERLRATGAGWVAETLSPEAVAGALAKASQPDEWQRAKEKVARWQSSGQHSCAHMADEYWGFYQSFLAP
jgi:glycosyltransferase involved in cell wall biosynthesis